MFSLSKLIRPSSSIPKSKCTNADPRKIVIDFSSPNIAKPFHYGHLKSTILGNFLANINRFVGNEVIKLNYIGDWGTQYGLLSLGLDKSIDDIHALANESSSKALRQLLKIYVEANEKGRKDNEFYNKARMRFLELDAERNPKQFRQWKMIRDISLKELKSSYERLGIEFDDYEFESDYADSSIKLIEQMMRDKDKNCLAELDDGAVIAKVEKNNKILEVPILKSDRSSLYLTRDVAAAINRKKKFNFDKLYYVVGADQEKHFHCLKQVIKNFGHDWHDQLIHVKMGKVLGMSSRAGNSVLLSDIVDEANSEFVLSTQQTPTSKVDKTSKVEMEEVGRHLALASMFIYDMRKSRTKNYTFDWRQIMKQDEKSGINLQTTYARLSSLIRRATERNLKAYESPEELDTGAIDCDDALHLLIQLNMFEQEFDKSFESLNPIYLVNYALALSRAINRAQRSDKLRVLDQPESVARTRLTLFSTSHAKLESVIKLIGLKPLSRV